LTSVLVLGSTGNIGSYVVENLLKKGVNVKAAVTNIEKGEKFFKGRNVKVVEFDFLRPDTYREALDGVSKLFLVRPPQLAKPKQDMLPFLKQAKVAGVKHIVFVSLLGVEKNPVVPHRKIENYIRELGFQYSFLRPSFFMQNLHTTHREDVAHRDELFMPVGKAKTSFIDTRDIAEIAAICLTEDGHVNQAYTLTGSEAISYEEVAMTMSEVLKRRIIYKNPCIFKFRRVLISRGTPKEFANVMTMLYTVTKLGTAKNVTDTTEKLLKRKPISFRKYVEDHQQWFK
jgi:uncharacterized protein YbjT (DUF2867 family)